MRRERKSAEMAVLQKERKRGRDGASKERGWKDERQQRRERRVPRKESERERVCGCQGHALEQCV